MKKFNPNTIILLILLTGLAACTAQPANPNDLDSENQNNELDLGIPVPGEEEVNEIMEDKNIAGTNWQWLRFESASEDENILVEDSSHYTLLFNQDHSYNAKVDCNQARGGYTLEGRKITIEPGPITRAICPPDSLDSA